MIRNSSAVTTMVAAEAVSDRPSRSRPRPATGRAGNAGASALSASLSRWRSISSQVLRTRKATNRPRNTTLVVTGDTATSMKKPRKAMSRASRGVRRV
jgi:hypothetical protein